MMMAMTRKMSLEKKHLCSCEVNNNWTCVCTTELNIVNKRFTVAQVVVKFNVFILCFSSTEDGKELLAKCMPHMQHAYSSLFDQSSS